MQGHKEAKAKLTEIGVSRWDTNPPQEGIIKWYNSNNDVIAKGKYAVILSVGPGLKYTMAYDIGIYKSMGIPFIEKKEDGPAVVEGIKEEASTWARAEKVAAIAKADFVYQCSTLLVAVTEFEEC